VIRGFKKAMEEPKKILKDPAEVKKLKDKKG
jgi:hypothetical protein